LLDRAAHSRAAGGLLLAAWLAANAAGGWVFAIQPMRAEAARLLGDDYARAAGGAETDAERREMLEQALEQYRRASSLQGNEPRHLEAQAQVHELLGEDADAAPQREHAMRLNPYSAGLARAQARLLLRNGKPAEALELAERAVELYPSHPEGHAALAEAFATMGRIEDARAQYERAAALEPHRPERYRRLGEALGRRPAAPPAP
jgi:tetratricopeptide (TPR) repeat protein